MSLTRNRFDRMEWAGAFGDLGTLIPFAVAYIAVVRVEPSSIFFVFGRAMAHQESQRAKTLPNPTLSGPIDGSAKRYAALARKLEAAREGGPR